MQYVKIQIIYIYVDFSLITYYLISLIISSFPSILLIYFTNQNILADVLD